VVRGQAAGPIEGGDHNRRQTSASGPIDDQDPDRWRMLALLCAAMLLALSAWMTATAVGPQFQARWELSAGQVGLLTTVVQIGFVVGTALAAVLNIADLVPNRSLFAGCAALAALANAALLVTPGYGTALFVRFLTGFFLAGVYPPGMKMISTWFRSSRGMAIGAVVGALTVGKAMPYLLKAIGEASIVGVIGGASVAGVGATALIAIGYRDGPYSFPRSPFAWSRIGGILRHRESMLATGGYLGHMWELYAAWSTIGAFFLMYFHADGHSISADLSAFAMIAVGGVGAVVAGVWADRWGRERIAIWAMVLSGACALSIGWMGPLPVWIVLPVALTWGITIVSDSAQFSAVLTEVAPPDSVGTALMLQASLGFALTAVSIQVTSWLASEYGWGVAYSVLAIGPWVGIASMLRLKTLRVPQATAG
jgi:MFS family permease